MSENERSGVKRTEVSVQYKYERREGFNVPVLVVTSDDEKRAYWGRSQYRARKVFHSGECPRFKAGVRFS